MQIKKSNLELLSTNHLLDIRAHLGHKVKYTHFFNEAFILGTIDSISIYNIERIWKGLHLFYQVLAHSCFRRNTFFLILTNRNISSEVLAESFKRTFSNSKKVNGFTNFFYILGYIHKGWYGGLLANWTRIYLLLRKFLKQSHNLTKKRISFLKTLKGVWTRQLNPTFPDFILSLDSNAQAFHESQLIRLPILGLSDVDTNPFNFSLYVIGNDDSFDNVEFFLKVVEEAILEGRYKEQELFFHLMTFYLYSILEQETF